MKGYIGINADINNLLTKCPRYKVKPSICLLDFVEDFEKLHHFVRTNNEAYLDSVLSKNKDFFDTCLKYPLDEQQRRAVVSEEDNCLVVSSAGSGKTSSIVAKVKYLTEIKGVNPSKILLISYTHKAALELTERIDTSGLVGYTFHKLALDIISETQGVKPSICDNYDNLIVNLYRECLSDDLFKQSVVLYYLWGTQRQTAEDLVKEEKLNQLTEQKKSKISTGIADMDGTEVYVRSFQEKQLCQILHSLGVKFRYEEPYEVDLADKEHSQYRPDFSIYFERDGVQQRIYLEHYGVNDDNKVPEWFATDSGISYEEACQKYTDGILWKQEIHKKYNTVLLTTTSADFSTSHVYDKLVNQLNDAGLATRRSIVDLYDSCFPKKSKSEQIIIRLIATFIALLKSSCKSIEDVLAEANKMYDERSCSIIHNIFWPVYRRYEDELRLRKQIDFTDAIIQATELCKRSSRQYEYIIVDEFQDISIDRYAFLMALRQGADTQAKMYCVGDDWQSIYRFSGSDLLLFNQFSDYFGYTEINKIETTYRFGEPLVSLSSYFIQKNPMQISKDIRPFNRCSQTELEFCSYVSFSYCSTLERILSTIPEDKSVYLLGRYSFDDYYLSEAYKSIKEGSRFYYLINGRKVEFLTVHKSKGLEADYVILLKCNGDQYGFPSLINNDSVLNYVLTDSECYPYAEERRLFYVAITRAKVKTIVLYDNYYPSVFVSEFVDLYSSNGKSRQNANKPWTLEDEHKLLSLYEKGWNVKYIAANMGRSYTAIKMRLQKLLGNNDL